MPHDLSDRPNIIVEEAKAEDVAAITQIGRETFAASFAYSMPETDMNAYLAKSYVVDAIRAEFENTKTNTFLVARSATDGTVAGFLQIQRGTVEPCLPPDLNLLEVHRVYVSMQCHGLGIGGKLLERAIEIAKAMPGCDGAWLGVWDENVRAQRFYASYGFTEKVGKHSFTMGECVQSDWILLLRFRP